MALRRGTVGGLSLASLADTVVPQARTTAGTGRVNALARQVRSVVRAGYEVTPADLFLNGERGLWVDPSDLTIEKVAWAQRNAGFTAAQFLAEFPSHALFQDSTGSTPVTALGQPVGLVLDKARGVLSGLGPDLVTNGDFTNGVNSWSSFNSSTIISTGTGARVFGANFAGIQQSVTTVAGRTYLARCTLVSVTVGTTFGLEAATSSVGGTGVLGSAIGSSALTQRQLIFTATGTTTWVRFINGAGTSSDFVVDDFSVCEIPGNHLRQTTSAARPTLEARVNVLSATNTLATQSVTVAAVPYTLSFEGTGTVTLSGASTAGPLVGSTGRVSLTFTPTAGSLTLTVSGTVTNAQLEPGPSFTTYQRVVTATDYADVGAPRYLQFDGTDDFLVSAANLDLSTTDKVSVFVGVRKESNGTYPVIVESSASSFSTQGTFSLLANAADGQQRWWAGLFGSASLEVRTSYNVFAAPRSAVLSALYDVAAASSTDEIILRENGAAVPLEVATGTTAGTGVLTARLVYIGRRGGAVLPLLGRIFQLVIRGAASTPTEVVPVERWIAARTGVAF